MSDLDRHVIVEDEALAAGFTQIPNLVLRRSDLQPGAKLTYMVLLSYAWQKDHAYPGQDRLASDMGVSERSVITYLKQLQETGLITIRRRGLGLTNIYVLHRISGSEKSASQAGSEDPAPLDLQDAAALEVQEMRPKNTQKKKTHRENVESSNGLAPVEKYDEDREVIGNYVTDFAREFADQAVLTSSVTRAQNLYRQSGLPIEQFIAAMYTARQITKERTASIKGSTQSGQFPTRPLIGGKPVMAYWFSVLEDRLKPQ